MLAILLNAAVLLVLFGRFFSKLLVMHHSLALFHVPLHAECLATKLALIAKLLVVRQQVFLKAVLDHHRFVANVARACPVHMRHILLYHQQK